MVPLAVFSSFFGSIAPNTSSVNPRVFECVPSIRLMVAALMLLCTFSTEAQTTVFEANFNSDSNGASGASPDAWSATTTSNCATMSITSGAWRFTTPNSNSCNTATAVWTSAPISISSFTGITLSYATVSSGNSAIAVSMSNGSLASSTFTPNAGATTTQITFTVNMTKKNNWHSLDNVVLTGTLSCTDTDGDGVCDDDEVDGCTDNTACNYNTAATDDDGTCTYATGCDYCSGATDGTGTVVDGSALTPFEFTLTVDNYPEEIAWYMVDDDASSTLIWGTGGSTSNPTEFIASEVADGATLVYEQCFDPSGSYTLFISDTYGDGLLGTSSGGTPGWTLVVGSGAGTTVSNVVAPIDINIGSPNEISIDFGCTDSGAGNFDSNANVDDGSCAYPGCTDASACNYDASASTDDGSCTYATTWYEDSDSDNAGDPNSTTTSCTQPAGYVAWLGMNVLQTVRFRPLRLGMRTVTVTTQVIRTQRRPPAHSPQVMWRWLGMDVLQIPTRRVPVRADVARRTRIPTVMAHRIATILTTTMMAFWTGWTPLRWIPMFAPMRMVTDVTTVP